MNAAAIRFLRVDLDMARLLLDAVATAGDPESLRRAFHSARTAHGAMVSFIRNVEIDDQAEIEEILEELDGLDFRLELQGY